MRYFIFFDSFQKAYFVFDVFLRLSVNSSRLDILISSDHQTGYIMPVLSIIACKMMEDELVHCSLPIKRS